MKPTYSRLALGVLALITIVMIPYGLGKKAPVETVYEMPASGLVLVEAIDQDAPLEHPDFIKAPYVSQIPEGTNLALEGKAEASSFVQAYTARKAIDGKSGGASYWEGAPDTYPNTLTIDLGKVAAVHAVRIALNPESIWGAREQTFELQVGTAAAEFVTLVPEAKYTFDPDMGNEVILTFDPVEAQWFKLVVTSNSGASGAQVAEFEIYGE
jgi:hypothetical protein